MSNWTTTTLGELVTFQRGHDLPKSKMKRGLYPVIGSNGIIGYHNDFTTEAPGITIGRSGNTGKPFLIKTRSWSHNTTLYIKEYRDADPLFMYYFLHTLRLGEYAGGSAVPTLNRNHIHGIAVTVPDLDSQRKIAFVLDSIDRMVELNTQENDYLAELGETIVSNLISEKPLSEMCTLVTDKVNASWLSIDDYVSTESLLKNRGGRQAATSIPESGKVTSFLKGDVLISNIRPYFRKIWCASSSGGCSTDVLAFRANNTAYASTLYFALRRPQFFDFVMRGAKGTKMPRGDRKQMLGFVVPGLADTKIVKTLDYVVAQMARNDAENVSLANLRDALLPKLMSGEIDVSKVDVTQLNNHLCER